MTKKIIDELIVYLKLKNYRELAEYLGVKPTRVYSWVKYGKITDVGLILVKNPEIDPGFLYTGEGPILGPASGEHPSKVIGANPLGKEKVVATIEPGNSRGKSAGRRSEATGHTRKGSIPSQPTTPEMLIMTSTILESDTVYSPALASNIGAFHQAVTGEKYVAKEGVPAKTSKMLIMAATVLDSGTIYRIALVSNVVAFHQAVQGEEEMTILSEKVDEQSRQIATLTEQVSELTKQLRQLLPAGKKREAAAGGAE